MAYKNKDKEKISKQKHYVKHKEDYIRRSQEQKERITKIINDLKSEGCSLCGEKCIPCLEFHHLDPSQKDFNISQMKVKGNISKLQDEIAKCVLLCANCHRKVHHGIIIL